MKLGQIDLALIDYHLHGQSGLTILREMRHQKSTTPVIIITADFNQQVAIECFRAGADDFVTKPMDPDYLKLVVNRTLALKAIPLKSALYQSLGYTRHKEGCYFHQDHNACDCGLADLFDLARSY